MIYSNFHNIGVELQHLFSLSRNKYSNSIFLKRADTHDKWAKPFSSKQSTTEINSLDIIGDIVILRNDKNFIIKVSNTREVK